MKIGGSMTAVHSICEAANDAFRGKFMAALTSDQAWDLGLRKFYFYYLGVMQFKLKFYIVIHIL